MPPARRGIQDIRTYAGRSTAPGASHKNYIRLSTLEMERTRRQHEYEAAQARADIAKERVAKLEAEIAQIVGSLGGSRPIKPQQMIEPTRGALDHAYGVSRVKRAAKQTQPEKETSE